MASVSTNPRFRVPLRLQGRNSVRVIWTLAEVVDWPGESWDPEVRERLRLIVQSLRQPIDSTGDDVVCALSGKEG